MAIITLLGHLSAGHGWPPTPSIEASTKTLVEGRGVVRQGDAYQIHCNPDGDCHQPFAQSGSSKTLTDGRQTMRVNDPLTCGDKVGQFSTKRDVG